MSIPPITSPILNITSRQEAELDSQEVSSDISNLAVRSPMSTSSLLSAETLAALTAPQPYTPITDECLIPILTPTLSDRKTAKVILPNGIQVYIVSDPNFKKSACALSVGVGSYDDPREFGGLAHFTEHLSFLGSARYPGDAEFDQFLSSHGGYSNASTHDIFTNYYFDVDHNFFPEGLSRFSDFFIQPIFKESGIAKEVNAVDNEFTECTHENVWAKEYILKELSNPAHPETIFDIGNKQSLAKIPREKVIEWHHDHYSSNIMNLTLCSSLSLEDIKQQLFHFSQIENKNVSLERVREPILKPEFEGSKIFIKPVQQERELTILRELPSEFASIKGSSPHDTLATILGDESQNSLLEQLKREDLAEELSAGGEKKGDHSLFFRINISLTEKGLQNIDTVIERCFQAIKSFKSLPEGIPQYVFDEGKSLSTLNYQLQSFSNASTCAESASSCLVRHELSTYPETPFIPQSFNKEACQALLESLLPERCLYMISCDPDELGVTEAEQANWKEEKWMKTKFDIQPVSAETLSLWNEAIAHPSITVAPPNPFIPTNFSIRGSTESVEANEPELIINEEKGSLHFKQDQTFLTPKLFEQYSLITPTLDSSNTKARLLASLYLTGLNESLNPLMYQASASGLDSSGFVLSGKGIELCISGYNDKAEVFLENMLQAFSQELFSQEKFESYKSSMMMELRSDLQESPMAQASQELAQLLYEYAPSIKRQLKILSKLQYEDLQTLLPKIFSKSYLQALSYGNVTREEAVSKYQKFQLGLVGHEPYLKESHRRKRTLCLPEGMQPAFKRRKVDVDGNAAILLTSQGPYSPKNRAVQMILLHLLENPLYDRLRTQLGLAYQVYPKPLRVGDELYNSFNISSNTHKGRELTTLLQMVLDQFISELSTEEKGLSQENFEQHKHGLLQSLNETGSLGRKGQEYAGELNTSPPDFARKQKLIQEIKDLELDDFVQLAKESLGRHMKKRVAIACDGNTPADERLSFKKVENFKGLRKEENFKE
ncbi:MAG: insulysin [Chlamydiales bacterium]|jgi:insulysin